MRFASSSLQCLATAATDAAMSSSRASSRGRNPWRRGFSDRPNGSRDYIVSEDSHFRSVRDINYGLRHGEGGNFRHTGRSQQQPFRPPPPHFCQPRAFRPPRTKPPDFRNWEYATSQPPSHCERFIVLSYNILADSLAINHRHELYFHIPRHILDWEWRKRNILFELGLWSPDIMCLQEVDRFQDLEEELKLHGYSGIWEMRTGTAIDGCAIFWRTWRFKLLHEECIKFNKLGLRDNVAQICVLESKNQNLADNGFAALPTSSNGANQVVVCNIHVLYNPKRGEIKLAQVRALLDRADAVSKLWNDAPVIICGDFNCTPKSPLYNFISEQKLNFSGLARNQISGQFSAQIYTPKPYGNPGLDLHRAQNPDNSIGSSMPVDEKVGVKQSNHISDMHQNKLHSNLEKLSLTNNLVQPQSATDVLDMSHKSCSETQYENEKNTISDAARKETQQEVVGGFEDEFSSSYNFPDEHLNENLSCQEDVMLPVDQRNDGVQELTPPIASSCEDTYSLVVDSRNGSNLCTSSLVVETMQDESVDVDMEKRSLDLKEGVPSFEGPVFYTEVRLDEKPVNVFSSDVASPDLVLATSFIDGVEVSLPKSLENFSSELIATKEKANPSTLYQSAYQVKSSDAYTCGDLGENQNLVDPSLNKLGGVIEEDGSLVEDHRTFSSESCGIEGEFPFGADCDGKFIRPESVAANQSSEKCTSIPHNSQSLPQSAEVQNDSSRSIDSELIDLEKNTYYDPYLWTPMEIETASGNAECTLLEHSLKLRSTYTEVEDYSGTRDLSREPQVTSYNRRFMGTVDYIWCSEGLKTVKVLDTIPKHALQWTSGFPTR